MDRIKNSIDNFDIAEFCCRKYWNPVNLERTVISMKNEERLAEVVRLESILAEMSREQDFDFPTELIQLRSSDEHNGALSDQSKKIMATLIEYKELMMMYSCALKQMRTKFEILDTEYNVRYRRNPINSINTRLKRPMSIGEKLKRSDLSFSPESIERSINDVAGIRVICAYEDDIYSIAKALIAQEDIMLIAQKDYIATPKPNGYRSLHLVVSIPVYFADHMKNIKVEVQLRTISMDFWASLEHQLKYKGYMTGGEEIVAELKVCADIISETANKMLSIRKKIDEHTVNQTDEEVLVEKMRRIDASIA